MLPEENIYIKAWADYDHVRSVMPMFSTNYIVSLDNMKMIKSQVGRPLGSLEYGDEAAQYILRLVNLEPKTTNRIKEEAKVQYFSKIHHHTVARVVETLHRNGHIRKQLIGRVTIWLQYKLRNR